MARLSVHRRVTLLVATCAAIGTNSAFAVAPYSGLATESTIDPKVVQIDETKYLGSALARDYVLIDTQGREFTLGDMMGRPLILVLSYYSCNGLCPTLNMNLDSVLGEVDRFEIGKDYEVLTVSFDKHDTPESARHFVEAVGIAEDIREGWRLAVLKHRETDIERLTSSVGFKYFWSRADRVFLHPNVLIFLTPEGRVARYLHGTAINKKELELALIDADWDRIADSTNVIDMLFGVCYSYNFKEGKYTLDYSIVIGVASLLLGISLVVSSFFVFRKIKLRGSRHG